MSEGGRGGNQEHRPWKSLAQSATSRETVALPKWSLAAAASNVKLSEGVSGEKNVLVLFLRPPGHWRHRSLKNFELSERREGSAGALTSSWRAASSALALAPAARAVRGHIFTRVLRTLPAPFRLPGNSTDLHRGGLIGRIRSPLPPMDNFGDVVVGKLCPS